MGVFLIKDDYIDPGVITATGLTPPSYDWENYTNFGDGVNMTPNFGGFASYVLTQTSPGNWSLSVSYSGMTPGAINVYLEPVHQETFNAGTSYVLYDATHTTGPKTWTDATVTANCAVTGTDHTTWCIAARRPDTMARLAVIAFISVPRAYASGDTWVVPAGCSLNDGGRIAISKYVQDQTDPDNWLLAAYLDTYQLADDGWTRLARTSTPYEQVHAFGFAKTLDTSILIASDFTLDSTTSGHYQYGYYVASYDETGAFTLGPILSVGSVGIIWSVDRRSMVRLPGTNDFLVVRSAFGSPDEVDLVRVSGDTVTLLSTTALPVSSWGTTGSPVSEGNYLVVVDASNVVSARWFHRFSPSVQELIQLLHYDISGATVTIATQEYTPNRPANPRGGNIMYPSVTGHQVETMYDDWTSFLQQKTPIARFGFDYSSGTFTTTTLPVDQTFLTNYNDPPNYPHRVTNNGPGFGPFAGDWTVVGDQIYITQGYYENSSDDTWFLAWQVDGTTGKITAYSWSKGPQDGAENDQLFYDDIYAFYDPPTSQLVVLSYLEYYPNGGSDWTSSNRMATYRLDYSLSAKLRSHRWAFTPTT